MCPELSQSETVSISSGTTGGKIYLPGLLSWGDLSWSCEEGEVIFVPVKWEMA